MPVEIQGLESLLSKLDKFPDTLRREVGRELRDGANAIARNAQRNAPKDEGLLTRGITTVKNDTLDYDVVSAAGYSAYLEFGTKTRFNAPAELATFAAQFKSRGPKIGFDSFFLIILDWVKRKGIAGRFSIKTKRRVGNKNQQLLEDFNVAWAIALSILRKGIHPQPFFFPAFFEQRDKIVKRVETAISDAIK
jgi:HK97 gp10 family phage protein